MPIKKQHVKCDFKDSRPLRIFIYVPIISAENNSKRYYMYYIGIKFHMTCTGVQTSTMVINCNCSLTAIVPNTTLIDR